MKLSLVQLIFLVLAFAGINGQDNKFIVSVIEHPANSTAVTVKCLSSIITKRHVVTTANCATVSQGNELYLLPHSEAGINGSTQNFRVSKISIHPNYRSGNPLVANIAVLELAAEFNTSLVPARSLGVLPNNGSCNLISWEGIYLNPINISMAIMGPQHCNATSAFCSNFLVNTDNACSTKEGSPIVCTNGKIDGILINPGNCTAVNNQFRMNYHSIGEYRTWIEQVSGAEISKKLSIVVILSSLLVAIKSFA